MFLPAPHRDTLGSSPLARGLLHLEIGGVIVHGIIPARAGFTYSFVMRERVMPDHPRSRGVYSAFDPVDDPGDGSSPLARGLLGPHSAAIDFVGIIPARAGFTSDFVLVGEDEQDHPRSRGVYSWH